ncbi:MAG: hypothetical protein WCS09_14870 [Pseudomonadota bacterium]
MPTESEGRLAAIGKFTFNLGAERLETSTHPRRVKHLDPQAAETELRRWV